MLTNDQQKFFFNLFKNAFYQDDKITIEEIYKNIEKADVRETRDKLLLEAEKRAIRSAKKAVKKIKNKKFKNLYKAVTSSDDSSSEKFGEELLEEIEEDTKKK